MNALTRIADAYETPQVPHASIIVISDDIDFEVATLRALKRYGLEVHRANNGVGALRMLSDRPHDVVILDLSLQSEDAMGLCRRLAIEGRHVITVTGSEGELERIISLEVGAGDSVSKPVHPRELLARVRAIVRREGHPPLRPAIPKDTHAASARAEPSPILSFSGWKYDPPMQELISPAGDRVPLSRSEQALLMVFLQYPQQLLDRDRLVGLLGEKPGIALRVIDTRVRRLRARLKSPPDGDVIIKTRFGSGYYFDSTVVHATISGRRRPPRRRRTGQAA